MFEGDNQLPQEIILRIGCVKDFLQTTFEPTLDPEELAVLVDVNQKRLLLASDSETQQLLTEQKEVTDNPALPPQYNPRMLSSVMYEDLLAILHVSESHTLIEKFGLDTGIKVTGPKLARQFGVDNSRIYKLQKRGMSKLRKLTPQIRDILKEIK